MVPFVVKRTREEKMRQLYHIVMIFMIGCFLGVVYETLYCYFQFGHFESRRGLIYGPFNVVYGVGAVALVEFLKEKKSLSSLFISGLLLGGIVEYMCSWVQETFFGSISWDYSKYFLNFDGRTSLFHMVGWGMLSMLFMAYLYPILIRLLDRVPKEKRRILTLVVASFFLFNMSVSGYACIRQEERIRGIPAANDVQKFFDNHYPDERLNKIYPRKKIVPKENK